MKKQMLFKTKGMNQDLSVSAFNPEFSFENMNLRLSTNEGNTLMSWVNEKGTLLITGILDEELPLVGEPIGTAVLNHRLVIFTTTNTSSSPTPVTSGNHDHIYVLKYVNGNKTRMQLVQYNGNNYLYEGNLNFCTKNPLETMVSYESESTQKVYWVDGRNQPRVVNISSINISPIDDTQFDFVPTLALNETITVEKQLGATGMFAPGVIQYAFTYCRKQGQESCIFYTSPLLYISYKERGASPEEKVENAFKITVNSPDCTSFDFLRIYSIQRTSINATPIVKRIQDISLEGNPIVVSYIDTGTSGDTVDPTELLYKGGESIIAETLEQKDNTLFLGNLSISRNMVERSLKTAITSNISLNSSTTRHISALKIHEGSYSYYNQLTSSGQEQRFFGMTVPCGGFKTGDWYRCGVQFQHKTGKWSDPIWIGDTQILSKFSESSGVVTLPNITGTLSEYLVGKLLEADYKKVRPVVVFPDMLDRDTICQGVAAPTLFTFQHRGDGDLYAQSSWFFRPYCSNDNAEGMGTTTIAPFSEHNTALRYTEKTMEGNDTFDPIFIRQVEVEGQFESLNKFMVDRTMRTLHSPDLEFDDQLAVTNYLDVGFRQVGYATFTNTLSDIDIQTETPTVSSIGSGFVHRAFSSSGPKGIVSGLFYDDCLVDDNVKNTGEVRVWPKQQASAKYLIYPWQGNGSLNNDFQRPSDKGTITAVLKKKVISNLRYTTTSFVDTGIMDIPVSTMSVAPQLFSSDEDAILKLSSDIYKGNIDTMVVPDDMDGVYFASVAWNNGYLNGNDPTPFNSTDWCKTCNNNNAGSPDYRGIRKWDDIAKYWRFWKEGDDEIGETFIDLLLKKLPVRIKYKSTPHLVGSFNNLLEFNYQLPIVEIVRSTNAGTRFGGNTIDALKENVWIPCGEPVKLLPGSVTIYYDYGDTYFQRYDCLKTYPYTREDPNQVVEIGSFMLETRTNIDGRYDRNRGQGNNINMSPTNFNLLNPVYSQRDNFFSYRIQDDDFYENNKYPNQITWSKTKTSDATVDLWTNVTMASTLELDGYKGKVNKLIRFNDQLIALQDTGISQILYNENVQISSTQGVPIEIANSEKVQGKRYLSNTIGCSNMWSVVNTPNGIYFMDSNDKNIYLYNGQLQNISVNGGFSAWCKNHIPATNVKWDPVDFSNFRGIYDRMNQDVLWINYDTALAFSEKLGTFTSFYDYSKAPYFCNLDDTGIWIHRDNLNGEEGNWKLWKHQAGSYGQFFNASKSYWMTLVSNPEPQISKTFTNIEFRACTDVQDGDESSRLPFDCIESWSEYQHGYANLSIRNGHGAFKHHTSDGNANLARKFRIWRCDIPRDNYVGGDDVFDTTFDSSFFVLPRQSRPLDRMRNPWIYLKLAKESDTDRRTEIHDLVVTYFT